MFQVLHSSAGAGKTHALVKHYLGLCLRGEDPAAYRQVLALTFTNKAAAEMKERVMDYLEAIAAGRVDQGHLLDVMDHLTTLAGIDRETMAKRADKVLGHMLHHWGDVAISTIDAFTRRVVQPFARDLQLDHELRMTTEQEHYRDLAVEALIGEAGVEPTLTGLLTEVCMQLLHDERKWDPERPLRDLSKELTKEGSIRPLQQLGGMEAEQIIALTHRLRREAEAFRARINGLGRKAFELIAGAGLVEQDLAYGGSGVISYFKKLRDFEKLLDPIGKNVEKVLESGKWHGGKAGPGAQSSLAALAPELEAIIHQVEGLRNSELKAFSIRLAVGRELLTAYTLHALDERLETIKRQDGVAFFSDLTRKVAAVVKHEPVPFIHERMGERYRHYLIDEFQDTSLLQWNALLPLVDNALSTGGSALLVGDAKQAIYRWRNGEVRLFTHFPKLFGLDTTDTAEVQREATLKRTHRPVEALTGNYRSASTIISFNNALFGALSPTLPESLRDVYDGHAQGIVRQEPGLVQLRVLDAALSGDEKDADMVEYVMRCVQEALDDGFVPGDIAVLVRAGKVGQAVSRHFVANGIQVVSPNGLQLSGDPLMQLLVHFLRFLHTEDPASATRVLQYQAILSAAPTAEQVDPFAGLDTLPDPVALLRRWIRANGSPRLRTTLADLVTQLARAHGYRPGHDVQLLTLLDEVHAWTVEHGQDIGGFLEHWVRSAGDRSVAPPEHGQAIQVMTVHKSKGLQFPVVIVPNACMASTGNHGELAWIVPGDAIPDLPVALVKEGKAIRSAELPELVEEEALRALDAMNLTYVAFTRPEQRLYALVPGKAGDAITLGLRDLIDREGDGTTYTSGERTGPWKSRKEEDQHFLDDVSSPDALANVTLRFEAPDDWDPADPDPYRAFGNAVHAVLERVHAPTDLQAAIAEVAARGMLPGNAAGALQEELDTLLSSETVRGWFAPGLEVRNEATMITPEGKALRPDRVVLDGERVRVLDIKTGKAQETHHDQVREYMHHLRALGHADVEGALLYVRSGTLENVLP